MEDKNIYEESFIVKQHECDCNSCLKVSSLMAHCQNISIDHCDSLGLDSEIYKKTHTAFLLAKASVEMYSPIRAGEKITIRTMPSLPKRAIYNRYTVFINERNEIAAAQDSKWVLVDTQTRRILRNPPEGFLFPIDADVTEQHNFAIPKVQDALQVSTERVTYSRTDSNGHLNNTRYADIILDALPLSSTVEKKLSKLVIDYRSEARMGESVTIFTKRLEEEQQEESVFYVSGQNENGKICFEAVAKFKG